MTHGLHGFRGIDRVETVTPKIVWLQMEYCWAALALAVLAGADGSMLAQSQLAIRYDATEARLKPPIAFGPQMTPVPPQVSSSTQSGTLSGIVTDDDGAGIASAQVTLTSSSTGLKRTIAVGSDGRFRFDHVPPGGFTVTASANGMAAESATGTLRAGGDVALPAIELPMATTAQEVEVFATQRDIAEVEVKTEEQQRLLGLFPNYYVAYNWHAAALAPSQKTDLAVRSVIDPVNLAVVVATAGIQQATNELPGYGPGAQGYGKRLGANLANLVTGTVIGGLILPVVLHQDPRFFYKGTGSIASRTGWAVAQAFIQRSDKGKWQPAYSGIGGDFASGAIANLYYPATNRDGVAGTIENGLIDLGLDALTNVAQEFLFKKMTPHSPNYPPTQKK